MRHVTLSRTVAFFLSAACAFSGSACDPVAQEESEVSFRPGGFSGGTLNTSNWVSAASRDVYESHRQGAWHSNGYGFETRLAAVVFDHPTLGKISTDPAAATPGQARVVITGSATFELKVKPPGGASEFFSGEDLVGSEFVFEVKYSGGPIYVSKLRILDHVSDPKGGALFEFHKVDPVTGDVVAPICEMSSNGDRLAAVFSDFSINTTTGAVSVTDKVIHIACTGASPGKSPLFGYGPKQGLDAFRLANRVIRADYCADGHPYTYPGNSLEIRDNFLPGSEGTTLADVYADLGDLELEAMWDENGILCMETPRVSTLEGLDIVCPVKTVAGQPSHNWKPPACDTFVDPNPTAMRFFSLTEPES